MTEQEVRALKWYIALDFRHAPEGIEQVCMRAIDRARRGDFKSRLRYPKGSRHPQFGALVPVIAVLADYRLRGFVEGLYK